MSEKVIPFLRPLTDIEEDVADFLAELQDDNIEGYIIAYTTKGEQPTIYTHWYGSTISGLGLCGRLKHKINKWQDGFEGG